MEQLRVLRLMIVALLAAAILVLPVAAIDISGQGVNVTAAETPLVGGDKPCGGAAAATTTEMMPGSDKDEHGCIGSAGYTWCEPKQTCLREWEEPCTAAATAEMTNEATAIPTTKSPLPAFLVIGALGAACVLAAVRKD
jgi:hypothetical protein